MWEWFLLALLRVVSGACVYVTGAEGRLV